MAPGGAPPPTWGPGAPAAEAPAAEDIPATELFVRVVLTEQRLADSRVGVALSFDFSTVARSPDGRIRAWRPSISEPTAPVALSSAAPEEQLADASGATAGEAVASEAAEALHEADASVGAPSAPVAGVASPAPQELQQRLAVEAVEMRASMLDQVEPSMGELAAAPDMALDTATADTHTDEAASPAADAANEVADALSALTPEVLDAAVPPEASESAAEEVEEVVK